MGEILADAHRRPFKELAYLPVPTTMLARGTALMRTSEGSTLLLCSQTQVHVLMLDRAVPHRSRVQPLGIAGASGAPGIVGVDAARMAHTTLLALALSLHLDAEQPPPSHGQDGHAIVIATVPPDAAGSDASAWVDAETKPLGFAPLLVRWLRFAESPTLAVSDANSGRLHVYSVHAFTLATTKLDDAESSSALGGLSVSLPSPVLSLAEWTCTRTGWSAHALGCEDGTLEFVATAAPPASAAGDAPAEPPRVTRQRIRVERALNVTAFFAGGEHAAESVTRAPVLHLLVGSVLCGACVYADVLSRGLHAPVRALHDEESVLCGAAWRSQPGAFFVGTWGRVLHCIRVECGSADSWRCATVWRTELPHAVFSVDQLDVTNDGLDELLVRTLEGLHVLQEDLPGVCAELEVGLARLLVEAEEEQRTCAPNAQPPALARRVDAMMEMLASLKAARSQVATLNDCD
ncbi:hypothetical protein KFE25_009031 [Diacronema lutheri]|uniref:Uncharacterized protein n=1 Tax=Diacronema lutheri TaxID=2081491 RepID=A0A8J5XZ42_DIALT|nr:hypothetical protein KFE25_009031 [Diacronema lutheri]